MWSISLRELAAAGSAAWQTAQSGFSDAPTDGVNDLGIERAQLALLSATMIGDMVLDAFAWAELVRRGKWSPWVRGERQHDRAPVLWTDLMSVLDSPPPTGDPMLAPARYLDVTLDAARDMLVAHRDPELEMIRGTGNLSPFTLHLFNIKQERLDAAYEVLTELWPPVVDVVSEPPPTFWRSPVRARVATLVELSDTLGGDKRQSLRRVYRLVGIASPDLSSIAGRVALLTKLYLAARSFTP